MANTNKPIRLLQSGEEPMKLLESCKKQIKFLETAILLKLSLLAIMDAPKKDFMQVGSSNTARDHKFSENLLLFLTL